ncbi:MAG: HD domain-containing phosphohydrolase [bacterium]
MSDFLVIDDQATSRKLISKLLEQVDSHANIKSYPDAKEALEWTKNNEVDLILVDYSMPSMNGVEFTQHFRRQLQHSDVPVVVITISEDEHVRLDALEAGATDFLNKPVDHFELRARCQNLLTLRRNLKSIKERNIFLQNQLVKSESTIEEREKELLKRILCTGEERKIFSTNHRHRIGMLARLMAEGIGLPTTEVEIISLTAPLHDIGKMSLPDAILQKPSELTTDEYEVARSHTKIGYEILKDSTSKYVSTGAQIALYHHERYDGTGYPEGLAGEQIPIAARIVAIIDVLDALASDRPYREAWPLQRALEYISDMSGKYFDPRCTAELMNSKKQIELIYQKFPD